MGKDIIYREDAIEALKGRENILHDAYTAVAIIRSIPSADRPQGEWIDKGDYAVCSNCGTHSGTQFDGIEPVPRKTNFCPNCGAKMKGAEDD